jgi:hypothetical protein
LARIFVVTNFIRFSSVKVVKNAAIMIFVDRPLQKLSAPSGCEALRACMTIYASLLLSEAAERIP